MRYKDYKEPIRARAFDRTSWADLARVMFDTHVKGSCFAVAGPYWFGQAFEDPPFFSYSANSLIEVDPQAAGIGFNFTCGVERWFLDDNGVYLGANVWFQTLEAFFGDVGIGGGYVDLLVTLSWEGMAYKAYFPQFNDLHPKSGPTEVLIGCPEEFPGTGG